MDIQTLLIEKELSVRETMKKLDETAMKILIIVENKKLVGVVTDGDIRRWILDNGDLSTKIEFLITKNPIYLKEKDLYKWEELIKLHKIDAIPIVNEKMEVINIVFRDMDLNKGIKKKKFNIPVVIMAGGKGSRLEPYTKILPKPLIPIGNTPISERIINSFNEYGCNQFYFTVNYKKNMIKAYFNEVDKVYNIDYVEENEPLGTAGSLYLLKNVLKETFFLSNCDILINGDYYDMLKYHIENNYKITLITSLKHYKVPYGVIELSKNKNLKEIVEKPEYNFLVNTGMYILEPEVIDSIPENKFFHITDLIQKYVDKGESVGVYPIGEDAWMDMGEFKEMENMLERLGLN